MSGNGERLGLPSFLESTGGAIPPKWALGVPNVFGLADLVFLDKRFEKNDESKY